MVPSGASDAIAFYKKAFGAEEDPFGHVWTLMTHVEDVSPEEMKKRMAALPQG
jgi:PhnB protein